MTPPAPQKEIFNEKLFHDNMGSSSMTFEQTLHFVVAGSCDILSIFIGGFARLIAKDEAEWFAEQPTVFRADTPHFLPPS